MAKFLNQNRKTNKGIRNRMTLYQPGEGIVQNLTKAIKNVLDYLGKKATKQTEPQKKY